MLKAKINTYTFYFPSGGNHQIKNSIQQVKAGKCLNCHLESNDLYFYQSNRLADCLLAGKSAMTAFILSAFDGFGGCTL